MLQPRRAPDAIYAAIAAIGGFLTMPFLATLCQVLRLAAPPDTHDYFLTSFLTNPFGIPYFVILFAILVSVGWKTKNIEPFVIVLLPFGFGLLLPLLIALAVEGISDPSSHNLFPLEVLFVWIPLFALALLGLSAGRYARNRRERHNLRA